MRKIGPVKVYHTNFTGELYDPMDFNSLIEAVCFYGYNYIINQRVFSAVPTTSYLLGGLWGIVFVDERGNAIQPSVVLNVADNFAPATGTRYKYKARKRQHFHRGKWRQRTYHRNPIKRHHVADAAWETDLEVISEITRDIVKRRNKMWHKRSWYDDYKCRSSLSNDNWKQYRKTQYK